MVVQAIIVKSRWFGSVKRLTQYRYICDSWCQAMPDWSHCLESSSISIDIINDEVKETITEMNVKG